MCILIKFNFYLINLVLEYIFIYLSYNLLIFYFKIVLM